MSNPINKKTNDDILQLKNKTVYSIPDNPSNKGFSAAQIKGKIADPILAVANWVKDLSNETYHGFDEIENNIEETVSEISEKIYQDGFVPNHQMTTAIIRDALTNINGRVLSAYEQTQTTIGGYNAILITKGGNPLTEEQARDYMEYMCGSRFLPQYDYEKPQNTIFVMANGTFWKPQYKTSLVGNSLVLYQISNPYELVNNKVSTLSASSTNTQYPSAKAVYDNLVNVREVAEGKTKDYVLSYETTGLVRTAPANSYKKLDETTFTSWEEIDEYIGSFSLGGGCGNPLFNSQNDSIDVYDKYLVTADMKIIVPYKGDLKMGDNIFVIETDVPDRWQGSPFGDLYKLETSKIDLTNYYAKNASLIPASTNTYDLGSSTATYKDLYLSGKAYFDNYSRIQVTSGNLTFYSSSDNFNFNGSVRPNSNGNRDLGSSSLKWKDLWINNIKGVATMTQAQYDALVSAGTVDADTFYFIEEE